MRRFGQVIGDLAEVALELPYGYQREAKPSLIFLPVRGDPLTNGFHAW